MATTGFPELGLGFEFVAGEGSVPTADESAPASVVPAASTVSPKTNERIPALATTGTIRAEKNTKPETMPADQIFFVFPEPFLGDAGKESRGRKDISLIFSHNCGICCIMAP